MIFIFTNNSIIIIIQEGKMNMKIRTILIVSIVVLIFSTMIYAEPEKYAAIYSEDNYRNEFVPGQVIVALKENNDISISDIDAFWDVGVDSIEELIRINQPNPGFLSNAVFGQRLVLCKLTASGRQGVLRAIAKLKNIPEVEYAEPDYVVKVCQTIPNDPDFSKLYGMNKIGAPQAWDKITFSPSVLVGVIDTGIDYNHPDLQDNIWKNPGEIGGNGIDDDHNGYVDDVYGWDFANNDREPLDDNSHGTHVSGIIAGVGNNGIGVAGVTWNTKLVALKFLKDNGKGSVSNAVKAIDYANKMEIPIINNSWGGSGFSQALHDAVATAGLFIAAAGNSGTDNESKPIYPACYDCDNLVTVASTDANDKLSSFSNYGRYSVDIAAPGTKIWSCVPGNSYGYKSGTSMATPHVSGAAALLKAYNPTLTTLDLKTILLKSTDILSALSNRMVTSGRLNIYNAILNVNL
jgi:thermitase